MRLLRLTAVLIAASSLYLAGAVTAQAAEWEIEEMPLSGLEMESETTSSSGGAFELTVPTLSLTIYCTSESGNGEILTGGVTGKTSIKLSGCVVSKFEKKCSVKNPGGSTGVLLMTATTTFFETEVKEVEKGYEEVVPKMTVEITGAECTFPTKLEMSGATSAEVPKLEEEAVERQQKFSKSIAEESGVTSLKLGENQAFLTGEDKEVLSGAHEGEALATTVIIVNPASLFFITTEAIMVTLENIGPRNVKITNIEIEAGPFTRIDANCKGNKFEPTNQCGFCVECNSSPSAGVLRIAWDVLNENDEMVGFGARRITLGCGVI